MLYKEYIGIKSIIVHEVGNKLNQENILFSKKTLSISKEMENVLINHFLLPFKSNEYFNFFHEIDINMNEVFVCISKIFKDEKTLQEQSVNLAKHLYEQSTHPQIKSGEFYTVYFKDCIIDGETVDAIGLFKSENKDTFLKVFSSGEGFEIETIQGNNINKLDKGCLIFNIEKEKGYIVSVVDNTSKGNNALYWIDDFLHIRQRKDEYHNTQNILSLCKNFAQKELPQQFDVTKAEQVDFLDKSIKFFKEKENFKMNEFTNEVIGNPEIIERFNQYSSSFQKDYDIEITDNFSISDSAVKKQNRLIKKVIKLDKNFDIYIHGNSELLEQGEDKKGKYYKVYYNNES
jgi:hypothetical protein